MIYLTIIPPSSTPAAPSWASMASSWSESGSTVSVTVDASDIAAWWAAWPGSVGDHAGPWRCVYSGPEPAP